MRVNIIFILTLFFYLSITKVNATTYYLVSGGALNNLNAWGTNTDGTGTHPTTFTGGDTWNIVNSSLVNLFFTWGVDAAATVNLGDGSAAITLYIYGSAGLGSSILNQPTFNILNNGTVLLETGLYFNSAKTNPQSGSTFHLSGNGPDVIALNANYFNLIIGNDFSIISPNVAIDGNLTINNARSLFLNGNLLTINGTISGNGELDGGAVGASGLIANGTGGTIRFKAGGRRLSTLTINLANTTDVLTLGSDLTVDLNTPNANLTRGVLSLNNQKLTLNGAIAFNSNFTFRGSTTSSLSIEGSGAITNNFLMDNTNSSTRALKDLFLNRSGASLVLGNALDIYGSLTPSVGTIITSSNLTLKSDALNKGRVGIISASGNLSGNVTVELIKTAGITDWVNLCPSGVDGQTFSNWNSSFPITCPSCPSSSTFNSIYTYDETIGSGTASAPGHYVPIPSIGTGINLKMGYWVYLGNGSPNTSEITIPLTGIVNIKNNSGNINCTLTGTAGAENGWNLIANPYPSPILVSAIISAGGGNVSPTEICSYDPDNTGFIFYNGTGSNSVIPMGQAFYVRVINNTALTPDETWKTTNNDNSEILKTTNLSTPANSHSSSFFFDDFLLELKSNFVPFNFFTQAYFNFQNGATANYDFGFDAYCLDNPVHQGVPRIFSFAGNEKLMRNVLPNVTGSIVIPFQVETGYTGIYQINPRNFNKLPAGACVVLHDLINNTNHDLKTGPYTTTINAGQAGPQFELIITVLPSNMSTQTNDPLCVNGLDGAIVANGTGNGPWNYTWKNANANVLKYSPNVNGADTLSQLSPGVYFVDVNTVGTCNNASAQLTLNAQTPLPLADFTCNTFSVWAQSNVPVSFTNLSQNATDFTWEFGNGMSVSSLHANYTYNVPGVYTVKLIAGNGPCQDFDQKSIQLQVLDMPLGITQHEFANDELVLVQEASGIYLLVNSGESNEFVLTAYNALGQKLIKEKTVRSINGRIDISIPASENLLFVKLSNENKSKTFKVVH